MAYFTDEELAVAVEVVLDNVLAPLKLAGLNDFVIKQMLHNYVQREVANALTAAAQYRQQQEKGE